MRTSCPYLMQPSSLAFACSILKTERALGPLFLVVAVTANESLEIIFSLGLATRHALVKLDCIMMLSPDIRFPSSL